MSEPFEALTFVVRSTLLQHGGQGAPSGKILGPSTQSVFKGKTPGDLSHPTFVFSNSLNLPRNFDVLDNYKFSFFSLMLKNLELWTQLWSFSGYFFSIFRKSRNLQNRSEFILCSWCEALSSSMVVKGPLRAKS